MIENIEAITMNERLICAAIWIGMCTIVAIAAKIGQMRGKSK
jgi:hypothetical protein